MKKVLAVFVTVIVMLTMPAPLLCAEDVLTGEITISCYETMRYKSLLEYAAKVFEQAHPGVKVNVSAFSAMPEIKTTILEDGSMIAMSDHTSDPMKEEDYLARINTEMMSGGGADIFAIDIIPYHKYADAGLLEDLRQYMDSGSGINYEDYEAAIFDAALYKEGQYILPIDYNFDCLSYDSSLMDAITQDEIPFGKYTYKELVDLGYDSFMNQFNADAENPVRLFNLYTSDGAEIGGTLFGELLKADYNEIIDIANKKANFTDGRFADILETSKEYSEKGYLYNQINYEQQLSEGINITEFLNTQASQKCLYKSTNQLMLIYSFLEDSEEWLGGYGLGTITPDDTLIGLVSNDKDESTFVASHVYAMNANSKNKDAAWEFLKFLLSDEIQGSMSITFTPVNKNAAAQKAKLTIASLIPAPVEAETSYESIPQEGDDDTEAISAEDYDIYSAIDEMASYSYFDSPVDLTDKQQSVFDKYADFMDRCVSMLNSYVVRDSIIDGMITKEAQNFFDGSKTADEVAAALQSRVSIYLQE